MKKKLFVHAGKFHADDVAVAAILRILNSDIEIVRVFNVDGIENRAEILIADIGGGDYDHHQKNPPVRLDGLPHCAASLVWKDFGAEVVKQISQNATNDLITATVLEFDKMVLRSICAADNGILFNAENENGLGGENVFSFAELVCQYNPSWNSADDFDKRFFEVVAFAEQTFRYTLERICSKYEAQYLLKKSIEQADNEAVLVLEQFVPWQEYITQNTNFRFVIYPSNRGGYNLQIVPQKGCLPSIWYGAVGETAQAIQKGMTFCHNNGFMAAFDSLENAYQAALCILN